MNNLKKLKAFLAHWGILILVIFHTVGLVGLLSPLQDWFIVLTPFNLLLASFVLISGHSGSDVKLLVFFFVSALLGFSAEVVGVQTGLIFGDYTYGRGLGTHLWGVPLTIGLNWFMLTCAASIIGWRFLSHKIWVALFVGVILVLFDVLMEPVAPILDYWEFVDGYAPLQNYLGWFIVAFAIAFGAGDMLKEANNHLAFPLIFVQALFFIFLNIGL
jgi:uncharacterized membrane protein